MTWAKLFTRFQCVWNEFFFAAFDLELAAVMRIAYAALLLVNFTILGLDLELWFGPDNLMPFEASRAIIDSETSSPFGWLPQSTAVLWICYGLAMMNITGLLVGWFPRLQAAGAFFWMVAFHHRNIMIFDGEDQLFRLFAFFFVFLPTHHFFSVHAWLRRRRNEDRPQYLGCAWAFRLFQIEATLVYVGAAVAKWQGIEWRSGIAMWYVSRLDDTFGKFPLPDALFETLAMIRALTWGTLVFEAVLPIALWIPRTRRVAVVAAFVFHLALEYTMNLFLFHMLMIVGLIPFLATDREAIAWRARSKGPANGKNARTRLAPESLS